MESCRRSKPKPLTVRVGPLSRSSTTPTTHARLAVTFSASTTSCRQENSTLYSAEPKSPPRKPSACRPRRLASRRSGGAWFSDACARATWSPSRLMCVSPRVLGSLILSDYCHGQYRATWCRAPSRTVSVIPARIGIMPAITDTPQPVESQRA